MYAYNVQVCVCNTVDCKIILIYILLNNFIMYNCFKVVGIMRVNVEKVLERDQKLSELDNRAGTHY